MACWQILVVDSDPPAALTTQHGLQRLLGPEAIVLIAPSPGAAWLHCVRQRVDLLIVDPTPQNLAAMALIKVVRGDQPQTAIMMLAAYDTPGLRHQMEALSIRHYEAKPIMVSDMAAAVRVAVRMGPVPGDLPSAATEQGRKGAYEQAVVLTDANRELLAFGGWPGWVQFVEELPNAPVQHSE